MSKTELGAISSNHCSSKRILIAWCRCFPHVVNLACKAILAALTDLNYVREPMTAEEQVSFLDAMDKDPIATIRTLIHVVCLSIYPVWVPDAKIQIWASSIHRQKILQIVKTFMGKDLQLLCDVDTRWSSALLMIKRALILEGVSFYISSNYHQFDVNAFCRWSPSALSHFWTFQNSMTSMINTALQMKNGMPFPLHVRYYWYVFRALKFMLWLSVV